MTSIQQTAGSIMPVRIGSRAKCRRSRAWIVWLALGSASLSKAMLIEGVSIGDVLFALSAVSCALYLSPLRNPANIRVPKWSVYIILLIAWAAVGGLFAAEYSCFSFSNIEFWKSFAKLSFYGVGAILLGSYFRKMEIGVIGKVVFGVLTLHALIALYIYVAQLLKHMSGIHLPYEFFWFGQGGPFAFGRDLVPWKVGGIVLNKARGIFSEPSTFGIFQVLGLAFLYFRSPTTVQKNSWRHNVIFASLLLTFSLSSYIMLSVFFFAVFALNLKERKNRRVCFSLRQILITVGLMFLIFSLSPLRVFDVFQERIIHRFVGLVQGHDRSGTQRLIGSWDTARYIVTDSPIVGAGLGNLDVAFNSSGYQLEYITGPDEVIRPRASIFNIPFYVVGSMGVIGFIIFAPLIQRLIICSRAASMVFLASLFASGNFLEPGFWVFYVFYSTRGYVATFRRGHK